MVGIMLLAFGFGGTEMAVIGVLAVMLFGKNLPDVARQVGRGWADLKKSLSGIQSEFNSALYSDNSSPSTRRSTSYSNSIDDYDEQTAPKFVPPPAEADSSSASPPSHTG
jgi:sec-independent protein translocase protein TatA